MWDNDECCLCRRLKTEGTVGTESLGNIQCHYSALQRPRIAVHHGIWRKLHVAISLWSKKKNNKNDDNTKWNFSSAISEEISVVFVLILVPLASSDVEFGDVAPEFVSGLFIIPATKLVEQAQVVHDRLKVHSQWSARRGGFQHRGQRIRFPRKTYS